MRSAKLKDYVRRLQERGADWTFRLERFSFTDIPSVGTGELPFNLPIVVLAGPNGVGKTTLLRALWAAAAPSSAVIGRSTLLKLSAGSSTLVYKDAGTVGSSTVSFPNVDPNADPLTVDVIHVDGAFDSKKQQNEFCAFTNVDDIINGVGARSVVDDELTQINYISRRDYREVKVYEVETDEAVAPFFEVSLGNDRYDSRTMGAGELALLHLWWILDRAEPGSVLLIEEPETYLSPASQSAISDAILETAVKKKLSVVLTSHSPNVIDRFPDECTLFLYRDGGSIRLAEPPATPALLATIGLAPHVDTAALVEDDAAKAMLRLVLERTRPALARRLEITTMAGEGNITTALRSVGAALKTLRIVGVYDGGMEGLVPADIEEYSLILPGGAPIEGVFKALAERKPEQLATLTGSTDVSAILSSIQGRDIHDWYHELGTQFGLSREQLFPLLFKMWLDDHEDNLGHCRAFSDKLDNALSV